MDYTLNIDVSNRFWSKVDKKGIDDCWEWKAGLKETGRGNFSIGRQNFQAHRMTWMLTFGEIPEGMLVCHHCDNGKCQNPNHLFLGTHKDNVRDMYEKGRDNVLRGEEDPKSILTEKQVIDIKTKWIPYKYSQQKLANEYGVARTTIQSIVGNRNWKHIGVTL